MLHFKLFKNPDGRFRGSLPQYTKHYTLRPPFLVVKNLLLQIEHLGPNSEFRSFLYVSKCLLRVSPDWLKADNPPCDENKQGGEH